MKKFGNIDFFKFKWQNLIYWISRNKKSALVHGKWSYFVFFQEDL
jgi:hypothetical protein